MRSILTVLLTAAPMFLFPAAPAQGSKADYERASSLRRAVSGKVYRDSVRAHWIARPPPPCGP